MVGVPGQAEPGQRREHPLGHLGAGQPVPAQPERDVLAHRRHHDLGVRVGEAEPDPAAHRRAVAAVSRPSTVTARVGQHQAVDQPGEGRLARAVGADHPDPLLGQRQVDAGEHDPAGAAVAERVADRASSLISGTLPPPSPRPGRRRPRWPRARTGRPAATHQLAEQPHQQHRAGRPPRVAERDRAALGADPVSSTPSCVTAGQDLPGERLVELDRADVVEPRARPGRSASRAAGHDAEPGPARVAPRRWPRPGSAGRAGPAGGAARASTTATAAAPSLTPQELPAVTVPSARCSGRSRASRSGGHPGPRPLVGDQAAHRRPSRRRSRRPAGSRAARGVRAGRVRVLRSRSIPASRGDQVGGHPHVRVAELGRGERRAQVAEPASPPSTGGQNRHGAVDADSTPPASTTPAPPGPSRRPRPTAASPLAHCRSTVSPGHRDRQPGPQRGDPGDVAAGPMQLPSTTSSTSPAGTAQVVGDARRAPARPARPRSSPASPCPAVPIGVRRAATITGRGSTAHAGCRRDDDAGRPPPAPRVDDQPRQGARGRACRPRSPAGSASVAPQPRALRGGQLGLRRPVRRREVGGVLGDAGQHRAQVACAAPRRPRRAAGAPRRSTPSTSLSSTVAPPVTTTSGRPVTISRPSRSCPASPTVANPSVPSTSGPAVAGRSPGPGRASGPRSCPPGSRSRRRGTARRLSAPSPQATNDSSDAP